VSSAGKNLPKGSIEKNKGPLRPTALSPDLGLDAADALDSRKKATIEFKLAVAGDLDKRRRKRRED